MKDTYSPYLHRVCATAQLNCIWRLERAQQLQAANVIAGFIFVRTFFAEKGNVHLFSSSHPCFDKCHETSPIFPRTKQIFVRDRSFGVIS